MYYILIWQKKWPQKVTKNIPFFFSTTRMEEVVTCGGWCSAMDDSIMGYHTVFIAHCSPLDKLANHEDGGGGWWKVAVSVSGMRLSWRWERWSAPLDVVPCVLRRQSHRAPRLWRHHAAAARGPKTRLMAQEHASHTLIWAVTLQTSNHIQMKNLSAASFMGCRRPLHHLVSMLWTGSSECACTRAVVTNCGCRSSRNQSRSYKHSLLSLTTMSYNALPWFHISICSTLTTLCSLARCMFANPFDILRYSRDVKCRMILQVYIHCSQTKPDPDEQ